jgi:small subunit ribosomal protein S20
MAHSLSAKKRIRQNLKRNSRNRWRKRQAKDAVKDFLEAVHDGDVAKAEETYRQATKTLDKVASTSTLHKNTAARRKSRLAKRLNALKAQAA